jgi:hypothetical protein
MDVAAPAASNTYRLFLSSADDEWTQKLRDRVKRLVDDVINPRLGDYREAGAQLTLVLLIDEIRPGTREELDAALAQVGVQVALLIFERPGGPTNVEKFRELEDYITQLRLRDDLFYDRRCGEPNSDEAWLALTKTLLDFTFAAMRNHDPRNVTLNAERR